MRNGFDKYLSTVGVVVMTSLLLVGAGCAGSGSVSDAPSTPSVAVSEPTPVTPETPVVDTTTGASVSVYKDGTYTATGHYVSPAGPETIDVTLTLKDDVVTSVTVDTNAHNPNTAKYQGEFADGISAQVVGKKIQDLSVIKVSGSSLTPKGFADAIAQIEAQAAA